MKPQRLVYVVMNVFCQTVLMKLHVNLLNVIVMSKLHFGEVFFMILLTSISSQYKAWYNR